MAEMTSKIKVLKYKIKAEKIKEQILVQKSSGFTS
jgi:hypothetical protein